MRILHTMLRVADLDTAINFYRDALGMKLLRQAEYKEGRFTLAFVGYKDEREEAAIELTYNWDTSAYTLGDSFGHVAIEVDDAAATCALVKKLGYSVTREAGPMKHGKTIIAFVTDPDGHFIELIQRGTQFD